MSRLVIAGEDSGLGGRCIPIDPFHLTRKARQYDKHMRFILNTRSAVAPVKGVSGKVWKA